MPSPNLSWVTRSPAFTDTGSRLPGPLPPDRADAEADPNPEPDANPEPDPPEVARPPETIGSSRFQWTSSAGSSSMNRLAGLYDGAPQAERTIAREM
ncbi:unannotated protein [freshwater metagenome]|uniref:Unannotated protein n=1 Tax=freshwater metagenome TaxID=449393 RepID=A0A6J7BVE1_9ZZZZ